MLPIARVSIGEPRRWWIQRIGLWTVGKTSKLCTWSGIYKDCQNLVSACINCQRYNVGKHGFYPPKSLTALLPFDHVVIDLKTMPLSKRGNQYYMCLIDVCTRFVFLRELPDKTSYSIARVLFRIFCDIGFPKILQSDNGGEFVNDILKSLNELSRMQGWIDPSVI